MSETLTPQQKEAVTNRGGKLLVSAAAGSGKTKVLVDRLMHYVMDENDPADLNDFLIITYTKAAAAELRGKIGNKLSELIAQQPGNRHLQQQMQHLYLAKISTVHAFCGDILREYAYSLDIPADFRIAEEMECEQLMVSALDQVMLQAYESAQESLCFCSFMDSQGFGRDDRQAAQIILKTYHSAMCHLSPEKWLEDCLCAVDGESLTDAEQTPWGMALLDSLKNSLLLHIDALRSVTQRAELTDGFEKPAALLRDTIRQLSALAESTRWDEIVSFGKVDFGRLTFSKKCTDLQLIDQIKEIRNACKKALDKKMAVFSDTSERTMNDLRQSSQAARGLVELVTAFRNAYAKLKKNKRILDFSDLEHYTLDLLLGKNRSGPTAAAREISKRFREVMVDEYQDSNRVQDAIFAALTEQRQNCFMVGDVKQSIYQFRLADPGIFVSKYNAYSPAADAKPACGRKVLLSSNFRSSAGIVSGVNHVFSTCMSKAVGGLVYGEEEMLREGIPHTPLGEPEVELYGVQIEKDTYAEEAAFVAQRIQQLLDGTHFVRKDDALRPIEMSDVVILLRSPGSVGAEFQFALEQRGIQCNTGDNGDLLRAPEIVTLKCILQIIDNPMQDIPLIAAMASPVFGFTAEELAMLRSADHKGSIYDAVRKGNSEKCRDFIRTLDTLRSDARMDSVCELLRHIFIKTDILQVYGAMPDGKMYTENLHTFYQLASDSTSRGRSDLRYFLSFLQRLEERGTPVGTSGQSSDGVTIMSIHKSKGLEFPVVFLCGLSRRFNEESVRGQVLCHKELGLGLDCVNQKQRVRYPTIAKRAIADRILEEGRSEELRVLYVAMTRARDRLIMTYAAKDLAADLREIAMRMAYSPKNLLAAEVSCPGEWVLQAAMTRSDAGAFFALGGNPGVATISDFPWKIAVTQVPEEVAGDASFSEENKQLDTALLGKMLESLTFRYPGISATVVPSKQTATQLKGRWKDQEISEGTIPARNHTFRRAQFSQADMQSRQYGTVMHLLMQHIRHESCVDTTGVQDEVRRMVTENLLTQEQADCISIEQITAFFQTDIGKKLRASKDVLREFKFSVLMDADKYYADVVGEHILLQGVVDCAIVEEDGILLLDFKTDKVTEETLDAVSERYRAQVCAYADALEEIFEKRVSDAYLYFFRLGRFVRIAR